MRISDWSSDVCSSDLTKTVHGIEFHPGKLRETLTLLAKAYLDIVLSPSGLAVFRVVIGEAPRFPKLARTFYLAGPQVMTTLVAEQLSKAAASGEVDRKSTRLNSSH